MIKLNDLAIGYNGEAILEHIDQEFDDGLIYGILAKSGAGKTTLLKTISGLLHPVRRTTTKMSMAEKNAAKAQSDAYLQSLATKYNGKPAIQAPRSGVTFDAPKSKVKEERK